MTGDAARRVYELGFLASLLPEAFAVAEPPTAGRSGARFAVRNLAGEEFVVDVEHKGRRQ